MDSKTEKKLERILIASPLGDDDIRKFLPNAKIIKYSELKNYNSIIDLLPKDNTYAVILYENQKNSGHWVCIMRYKKNNHNIIEFFDSLADDGRPDSQLKWIDKKTNLLLGQGKPLLTELLQKIDIPVIYNKLKFQSEGNLKDGNQINTCGKHVVFRILNLLDKKMSLKDYIDFMNDIKIKSKNTYDEIVTHMCNPELFLDNK
jgi:hypothetical protein